MIHTVTLPAITVTLETKDGTLPEGTMIQLSVPVKHVIARTRYEDEAISQPQSVPVPEPVRLSGVEGGVEAPQPEAPNPPIIAPAPIPEAIKGPVATFDRSYENVEFRSAAKRFNLLGNAMTLGLSDADWSIVLNVRFVNFNTEQRIIGSATYSGPGSSLQIGTLKNGALWVDTIGGMETVDKVELSRWYEVIVSHHTNGLEKIHLDKKLIHQGHVPTFHSTDDVYVGRWLNTYHDFDLRRVRIYPMLTDQEVISV